MAKEYGFAVIGLGIGMHHCAAIEQAKGARLAAVCDHDPERLAEAMKKHGCHGYSDWKDLLADPGIDCVNITVESGKHAEFGVSAAKAGKHIIVEKPVDISPSRVKRLRDAVTKAGVKAACVFQSRMDPLNIALKKAIDKGRLGKLIGVHGHLPWYRAQEYYEGPHGAWKGTWELDGGGSLMNQGVHTVDLLQWLAGPVEEVAGFCGVHAHDIETEDQTVAVLRFANGALGTLLTTTCAEPGQDSRIYVYGDKGSFSRLGDQLEFYEAGPPKERKRLLERFGAPAQGAAVSSDPMAVPHDGHRLIVEDMARALRNDREPAITLEAGTHAVEIACAIYKANKTGRTVKIASVRK